MGFYDDWKQAKDSGIDDAEFIVDFLNKRPNALLPLIEGTQADMILVVDVLSNISLELFIQKLALLDYDKAVEKYEVPQFSSFNNGAIRIPELLQFSNEGLTLSDLGYQITKTSRIGACIKYGENHSKLAELMSLVTISKTRPAVVKCTSLGKHLVAFEMGEKADILKKLLLRNYFIQCLISKAKEGLVNYSEIAQCLSESTRIRRRSNAKYLVNFILEHSSASHIYKNINW